MDSQGDIDAAKAAVRAAKVQLAAALTDAERVEIVVQGYDDYADELDLRRDAAQADLDAWLLKKDRADDLRLK